MKNLPIVQRFPSKEERSRIFAIMSVIHMVTVGQNLGTFENLCKPSASFLLTTEPSNLSICLGEDLECASDAKVQPFTLLSHWISDLIRCSVNCKIHKKRRQTKNRSKILFSRIIFELQFCTLLRIDLNGPQISYYSSILFGYPHSDRTSLPCKNAPNWCVFWCYPMHHSVSCLTGPSYSKLYAIKFIE